MNISLIYAFFDLQQPSPENAIGNPYGPARNFPLAANINTAFSGCGMSGIPKFYKLYVFWYRAA